MKRLLVFTLILCLLPLYALAEEGKYMVFTGIYWDDSLDKVQSYLGKGSVKDYGNKKMLVYEDQTFAGYSDVDYNLKFVDDQLKSFWFLVDLRGDSSEEFLGYYIDAYGTPIRTDSEAIIYRTFTEKPEGNYYLWFLEEDTILYVSVFPSMVHVEMEQYIEK